MTNTINPAAVNAAFTTEATINQVADQLTEFSLGKGDGAFIAPTAYNTAVLVTRKVTDRGYIHQVDGLINTKVVPVGGTYAEDKLANVPHVHKEFSDDHTVIAIFSDAMVIIEVDTVAKKRRPVDCFENFAYTNLYAGVELLDI